MLVKKTKQTLAGFLIASFISACATPPDKISPAYISPLQYSSCDCDQIKQELLRVNRKVMDVAGVQQRTANKDSAAMAVGLVLFWPALFFLASGDNRKEELARLKGEYECLESLAIEKRCDIAPELEEARRLREEEKKRKEEEFNKRMAQQEEGAGHK